MSIRLSAALAIALAVVLAPSSSAQAPYVVTTLPSPSSGGSSNASQFTMVGDAIYFQTVSYSSGALWKWTETDGVKLVKSTTYTEPFGPMIALGDKLLFQAQLDTRGKELWITDGTAAGTTLVKDIYAFGSSTPVPGVTAGGKTFFSAFDSDHGRELWVTDGTEAGTLLLKDLDGAASSSSPMNFTAAGGKVYFNALDKLWVSDGTEFGTIALASSASTTAAGVLGSQVLFLGSDPEHGRELWSSDGTVAGTSMVKDINPGTASSWGGLQTTFARVNGVLYFFAEDAASGRELWKSDGTAGGTQLVADITAGPASSALTALSASQSGVFFLIDNKTLWFSDGTTAGTLAVRSFTTAITAMLASTTGAFVVTPEAALYYSNGTVAGTIKVTNATPVNPPHLTARGASMIFINNDPSTGREPWISDGTTAGTKLLADVVATLTSPPQVSLAVGAGNNFYFSIGDGLMRSDGTAQGTIELAPLVRG